MDSTESWLCIPCFVCSEDAKDDAYHIYFVDLSRKAEDKAEDCPKLRVSRKFKFTSFWVKGDTLFLFSSESFGKLTLSKEFLLSRRCDVLEDSMISYSRFPMKYKRDPMVVPTPDGKVLVMSSIIHTRIEDVDLAYDDDDSCIYGHNLRNYKGVLERDFEIYDPEVDEWETLPSIQPFWPYRSIDKYSDVVWAAYKDETLLVNLSDEKHDLMFRFNGIWRACNGVLGGGINHGGNRIREVRGDLCFTPDRVFDIQRGSWRELLPSEDDEDEDYYHENYCYGYHFRFKSGLMAAADFSGGYCFYSVQTTGPHGSSTSHMRVQTFSLDIDKYNLGKRELEKREVELLDKIKKLFRSNINFEKVILVLSLLDVGKLEWKLPPVVQPNPINSLEFKINRCSTLLPFETLSLCRFPSFPAYRKRPISQCVLPY